MKYLAESVIGGEMRETADKESAIRIAGDFRVPEGVICKNDLNKLISAR